MNKRTQRILVLIISICITSIYSLTVSQGTDPKEHRTQRANLSLKQATVIRVIDGDTFLAEIDGEEKRVRLIGIDTPESVDPRKTVECFGKEAAQMLRSIFEEKEVLLESDPSQGEQDKYGRLLRYGYASGATTSINAYMIKEGYAHEYTYTIPYRYRAEFKAYEQEARLAKRGLWNPAICPQE